MTDGLSARGQLLAANPPLPEYIHEHFDRAAEPFDPVSNPGGYISMCIAENKLTWDLLEPKMAESRLITQRAVGYDAMIGSFPFREELARFMGRTFLGRTIAPEQLAVLTGAGSVLELLFYALCDPGDGVLVPTPSYAGFWADLETRDELKIVPVHCNSEEGFRLTRPLLDAALADAGRPVTALLFTTPNNPLGWVYSADEVEDIRGWAEERGIHVVFDEVYALSVFGDSPFASVASLRLSLGDKTHLVWAFSKDFAMSGLRCGVLLTENEAVLNAVDGLAYWACVSGDTQQLLQQMIADDEWVDEYLTENQRRLGEAYSRVTAALDSAGVRYFPAEAGFFILCDMRRFMTEISWEAEATLWRSLLETANVNLTPGSACHVGEPGFMRLCFTSEPTDAVVAGIERIGRVLDRTIES
ncbi:MAG: aminotransferase class I/II-fold pyridoxal phosphate-dependent enzyme [Acidimicrobiia bacterium]|nr:aminotransferase class I/II-fold pyridoxal phosphate-dependent enzyme [Acidimicrobiia bacterium]